MAKNLLRMLEVPGHYTYKLGGWDPAGKARVKSISLTDEHYEIVLDNNEQIDVPKQMGIAFYTTNFCDREPIAPVPAPLTAAKKKRSP